MPASPDILFWFVICSVLGWFIDTGFRSLVEGRYAPGDGYPFPRWLPFSPIYGLGAVIVLSIESEVVRHPILIEFLILSFVLTLFEYVSAVVGETLSRRRLWDYSYQRWNLHGRVSLVNSTLWGVLGLLFIWVIKPWVLQMI